MTIDPWHVMTANFGEVPKPYTALATLLDMILYFLIFVNAGHKRGKYKIQAPSMDGPDDFLRAMRVQANTVEQLVLHLPLLWIAAYAMDDVFAALCGLIWLFGRSLYAVRYMQRPQRRLKGFVVGSSANVILMLGALAGTIASF